MHVLYLNSVCILKFLLFFSSYWLNTSVQTSNTSNMALPATSLQILQMLPMIQTIYAFSASFQGLPNSLYNSLSNKVCKVVNHYPLAYASKLSSVPHLSLFWILLFIPQWLTMLLLKSVPCLLFLEVQRNVKFMQTHKLLRHDEYPKICPLEEATVDPST